jgi:flavin reductase (DIM6/NTAB) family NADH-FMN oxidoreductase RutF
MEAMNQTSAHLPHGADEFTRADVTRAECTTIDCPRVANAPATLECRMTQIITLEGGDDFLVIGTVTGVHMAEDCLTNGRFDPALFGQMGRLGYFDYVEVREAISLRRPD